MVRAEQLSATRTGHPSKIFPYYCAPNFLKTGRHQGFAWSNLQEDEDPWQAELFTHPSMPRSDEILVHRTLPHPSPGVLY